MGIERFIPIPSTNSNAAFQRAPRKKRQGRRRWPELLCILAIAGCAGPVSMPKALALNPLRSVYQYQCRSWTREQSLPFSGVNAIVQSKDGYIWLGTHKGLARFDGIKFTMHGIYPENEPDSTFVTSLAPSREGGLWFGLQFSGYGYFDGKKSWFLGADANGGTDGDVNDLIETSEGVLVTGASGNSIWRTSDNEVRPVFNDPEDYAGYNVTAVYEDSRGRVWMGVAVGAAGQGVFLWEDGKVLPVEELEIDADLIMAIAEDKEGAMWFGTHVGLRCYDANLRSKEVLFPETQIPALLVDRHGVVWIGTTGEGLACWKNGEYSYFKQADGLADNYVNALAEDREGNLWIGTRRGLSQLSDVKFPTFTESDGFGAPFVQSVSPSPRGGLWASTSKGLIYYDGDAATPLTDAGLGSEYVKRALEDSKGDLYVVSGRNEIEIISGGRVVARHATLEMPVALTEDARSVVASVGGSLYRVGPDLFEPYAFVGDIKPELYWILNLATASDGSIWVASVNGVCRVQDGRFEHWTSGDGLGDHHARWVCEDDQGIIWAGLSNGIARFQDGQLRVIRRDHGLFDANIRAIVPDLQGHLWVDAARALYRINRQSLRDFIGGGTNKVDCFVYDSPDAVKLANKSKQENSGCRTQDGRIWFPSLDGVVMIDPNNIETNPLPPPVVIESIAVDGLPASNSDFVVVESNKHQLEIKYTALSFTAPQSCRFKYRLEGLDEDWVEAGERRVALYGHLPPGKFRFHVIAANEDGVWNEEGASFQLTVQPAFHQTLWFRAGSIALLGVIGLVAYRRRIHLLRVRERKLQEAVDQKTELLRNEIEDRKQIEETLQDERNLLRTLIDHVPDCIYIKDVSGAYVLNNLAHIRYLGANSQSDASGRILCDFLKTKHARNLHENDLRLIQAGETVFDREEHGRDESGERYWRLKSKIPLRDSGSRVTGLLGISRDITSRKRAEQQVVDTHKQLLEASRQAGMAEVATGVLHNVGNVLNSVNVSTNLIADKMKRSKIPALSRLADLLRKNEQGLAEYLTQDSKGRQIPEYIDKLASHLSTEQEWMIQEIEGLRKYVEHLKEIVAMQQSYARVSGVKESVDVTELVEDTLRLNSGALARHDVSVIRDYHKVPPVSLERHKVLQILVNLVRNAKYACDDGNKPDKKIKLHVGRVNGDVEISVEDNGVGISSENLTRIFNHGFTTRKNGHGFGLHSAALAAKELGGTLSANSRGVGSGARFTLRLPVDGDGD